MSDPTYAFFRTDKTNHLVTVGVALHPSPDWFLGVTRFELCQKGSTWLQERELNLYLWDAGTDSGVSYEVSLSSCFCTCFSCVTLFVYTIKFSCLGKSR